MIKINIPEDDRKTIIQGVERTSPFEYVCSLDYFKKHVSFLLEDFEEGTEIIITKYASSIGKPLE